MWLPRDALQRRAGAGVEFPGHAAGSTPGVRQGRRAAWLGPSELGLPRRQWRCSSARRRRPFHGQRRSEAVPTPASTMRGTSVIVSRRICVIVARFCTPRPDADGRGQRHDGRGSGIDEAMGIYDVVIGIGQDDEAFFDQSSGGFERPACRERGFFRRR